MSNTYNLVSGIVFGGVAALQAVRAVARIPVQIGSSSVPVLASWVAAIVAGGLCAWAFRSMT